MPESMLMKSDAWESRAWEGDDLPGGGRSEANRTVVFLMIAGAVMLFTTFTASYLVRREAAGWGKVSLPAICWVGTAFLAASSVTMELARRKTASARLWLGTTIGLGVLFALGQVEAWRQLRASGVTASSGAHSGFVYMLTSVHAAHLAAGIVVLVVALRRAGRGSLGGCAAWWHFTGAAWIWVAAVLTVF